MVAVRVVLVAVLSLWHVPQAAAYVYAPFPLPARQQQGQQQQQQQGQGQRRVPRLAARTIFGSRFPPTATATATSVSDVGEEALAKLDATPKSQRPKADRDARRSIVLVAGFETFNLALYKKAAAIVEKHVEDVKIHIFTDQELIKRPVEVEAALRNADVLFASLLFDYEQVVWLKERIQHIPHRFCFESALELMAETQVGTFNMKGERQGPPPVVKSLLQKFGSNREEDRMAAYLSFLKVGPALLKFVPGTSSIQTWLEVYSYWNMGSMNNVVSMLYLIIQRFALSSTQTPVPIPVVETPQQGLVHPDYPTYFTSPLEYVQWYTKSHAWVSDDTPRIGILLYRKHVLTEQGYIPQMIRILESQAVMPIPVFINGVEAHTVVRDLFTTSYEQMQRRSGVFSMGSLSPSATRVDAIVNTVGFPLVGGPAGSMEGGRQISVAQEILTAKNVPYMVAAPLLIQDLSSWRSQGVQGLQTVVLYSLPELDGAIDTVVLGGLVGDKIALVPERVRKLANRVKAWVELRKTSPKMRRSSIIVYGFPPNVGAVGTAALLNVPSSLERMLKRMSQEGYDLGGLDEDAIDGQSIIGVLRLIAAEGEGRSLEGCKRLLDEVLRNPSRATFYNISSLALKGAVIDGMDVDMNSLKQWLGKSMTTRLENQWGELSSYRGLGSSRDGKLTVVGLRLGKVWIGIQPLLGIEGDPMRLLFDRDLTPHPQYAAFYKWLQNEFSAHCLVHFGMHGTEEWLPGSPLGNTAESWSDVLSGNLPNVYLYACNNPSESLLAKRRGYATIVSHNVPPYSRAGLYKEVAQLRELINDYKQDRRGEGLNTIPVIVATLEKCGMFSDLPFTGEGATAAGELSVNTVDGLLALSKLDIKRDNFVRDFKDYTTILLNYLSELENRLFSDGLHSMGAPVTATQVGSYLDAVFCSSNSSDSDLSPAVLQAIAEGAVLGLSSSELLLRAARSLSGSRSLSIERQALLESSKRTGYGVDWKDALTLEDQFMFSLQGKDLLKMILLRISSSFGSKDADFQIRTMIGDRLIKDSQSTVGSQIWKAVDVAQLLVQNPTEELNGLMRALKGEYVKAAAGGDVIRDGSGVLPMGRNIHALDPYRIPSAVAVRRGRQIAEQIIADHKIRTGKYPETIAVTLWGLDTIKTKGESVGIVLGLVGAQTVTEATGRIVGFKLIPLEELGRPRVDVLGSLSGIFRDSFGNVVSMLDELFEKAAAANEPENLNHVKKHTVQLQEQGIDRPTSRLFSNPPGDFGSMVNEKVSTGEWEDTAELGDTWEGRNAFTFGKGDERGKKRPELLKALLRNTERIVQEVDSVEYGLTDIQEYYANTGALKSAAESARGGEAVGVSVVETFEKQVRPRELEDVLRLEYRSKLLNPRWAEAMAAQGGGGAYEISQRMTALLGWGGTTGFREKWVYDGAAERYALDAEMARKLQRANPEAFQNILRRMLEANGRGWWTPDSDVLQRIQELYVEAEDDNEFGKARAVEAKDKSSVMTSVGG